jgi:hypothetical protein
MGVFLKLMFVLRLLVEHIPEYTDIVQIYTVVQTSQNNCVLAWLVTCQEIAKQSNVDKHLVTKRYKTITNGTFRNKPISQRFSRTTIDRNSHYSASNAMRPFISLVRDAMIH